MQIAVLANDEQWKELFEGGNEKSFSRMISIGDTVTADAYIILKEENVLPVSDTGKPVFVNAVIKTLSQLNAGKNVLRVNGWKDFLQRNTWEVAGTITAEVEKVFTALNKQFIQVADEPGLVAARSISMIINEAYFALGEEVSTKTEIDTAMKLGTNYPYGPFEWAGRIGVKNIYALLVELGRSGKRYVPAPLLEQEATA